MEDSTRTLLSAFAAACLLFALAALVLAAPFAVRQYEVLKHWPEARAQILSSKVVQRTGNGYAVQLELLLQIGGQPQVVTTELPQPGSDSTEAQSVADRYHEGRWVPVRYNPLDITLIRLAPDHPLQFFRVSIVLGGMAVFFGVAAGILFRFARKVS